MRTQTVRRPFAALTVCAITGLTVMLGTGGSAHAANTNNYSLTAEGDGFYISYSSQGIPAVPTSNVSPYAAQSKLGSGGNSTSFAGAPYLGPQLQTISSLVSGLSGARTPPLPPVPGYATSDYPGTLTASESNGPYVVQADSGQFTSSSEAALGVAGSGDATSNPQIFSKSNVTANDDGSVIGTASAGVDGLSIGGIINALNVSTSESLAVDATGKPKVTSTQDLGSFKVLGFKIGIDQSGFTVLGDSLGLPTKTILKQVNGALAKAGFAIGVLPATTQKTAGVVTGVTSGGLEVKLSENVPALGPTTVDMVYGRSTVSATDAGTQTSTPGGPPTSTPSTGTTSAAPPATSTGTTGGSSPTGVNLPPTSDTGSSQGAAPAPVIAPASTNATPIATLGVPDAFKNPATGHFAFDWYLAIVLAGAGIVAGSQIFRNFGVRLVVGEA